MDSSRDRLLKVGGAALYVALVYVGYLQVHQRWAYMGFEVHAVPLWYLSASLVAAAVPALWMPMRLERPSQAGYWLVYLLAYVPSILVPPLASGPSWVWIELDAVLLSCMAGLGASYRIAPIGFRRPVKAERKRLVWVSFILAALGLYAALVATFGLSFELPSFSEIYDVREDYTTKVAGAGAWIAYSLSWTGNVVNPFLMVMGLATRRWTYLAAGTLGQVFLFGITALKSFMMSTVLIAAIFAALRNRGRHLGNSMLLGASGLIAAGLVEFHTIGTSLISDILVRRLIMVPGLLTSLYVDFFSHNPKAFLSHSILRGIVPSPYDLPPPRLVGSAYFEEASANANVWADGFANFGLIGVILATIIVGVVLWTYDSAAQGLDPSAAAAMFGLPALSIVNSAVLTALLTHGIGLVTLVALFAPGPLAQQPKKRRQGARSPPKGAQGSTAG